MTMFTVFCHLSRHLVSGYILFHQVSPSEFLPRCRLTSTAISNIFLGASSLSRVCTCPNRLNLFSLRNTSINYMWVTLSICIHFPHDLVLSFLLYTPPQLAHFNCVQFPLLLLSNCPKFCNIHRGRLYSILAHFVSFNFVGMFLLHNPPLWPANCYSVAYTFLSTPPLEWNNEPTYLTVFTVFTSFSRMLIDDLFSGHGTQIPTWSANSITHGHPWCLLSDTCLMSII